jgi:hypothetical protein
MDTQRSRAILATAAAMMSLAAKIAVGGWSRDSSAAAAAAPLSKP